MITWVLKWVTSFRWFRFYSIQTFCTYSNLLIEIQRSRALDSPFPLLLISSFFLSCRAAWLDYSVELRNLILQRGSKFQLMFIGGYVRWDQYFQLITWYINSLGACWCSIITHDQWLCYQHFKLVIALCGHLIVLLQRVTGWAIFLSCQGVSRALVENSGTLRLPIYLHERLSLIRNAKNRLEQKGITPTIEVRSLVNNYVKLISYIPLS